jgi:hypothetical protein
MRGGFPMRLLGAAAALAWLAAMAGCASVDRNIQLTEEIVTPIAAGEAEEVSADDLAEAMLRAGFTPQEVLEHGPEVHHALAASGGAQVRQDKLVQALFAVHSGKLYVTSRTRGTFVLPLEAVAVAPAVVVAEPVPAVLPVPAAAPDLIAKPAEIVVKP